MGLIQILRALVTRPSAPITPPPPPSVAAQQPPPPPAPPPPPQPTWTQPPWPQPTQGAPLVRDPLLAELASANVPADLAELVVRHREWLAETMPEPRRAISDREQLDGEEAITVRLEDADDDRLRATATLALARIHNASSLSNNLALTVFSKLARRKMSWTAEQVGWLLRCPTDLTHVDSQLARNRTTELAQLGVTAAERVSADAQATLAADLTTLLAALETSTAAGAKLAGRINALLQPPATRP